MLGDTWAFASSIVGPAQVQSTSNHRIIRDFSARLRGFLMIIMQKPAQPFATLHRPAWSRLRVTRKQQDVVLPLMITFLRSIFAQRQPQGALAETGARAGPRRSPTRVAPALKAVIANYDAKSGVVLKPQYDAENLSSMLSLVTSAGGVTLMPLYVKLMLPSSVVIRQLQGDAPTIELVLGYSRSNTSALVKSSLALTDRLVARVANPDADFLSVR
jgi:hypothetical protein